MRSSQKPSINPSTCALLFQVGDVLSTQLPTTQHPVPFAPMVVIATMELLFGDSYCWEVQCRILAANGCYVPGNDTLTFCQYIGTQKTEHAHHKVGRCEHQQIFFAARFDPPPKPPEPVTVYILPYNKVFVAYHPERGFLAHLAGGTDDWRAGRIIDEATLFSEPSLARVAVARWFDNAGPEVGPVRFHNPAA